MFPERDNKTVNIAGWSDGVFRLIEMAEASPNAQVEYIQNYFRIPLYSASLQVVTHT